MPRLSVRMPDDLAQKLNMRSEDMSESIRQSLERYFSVLDHGRRLAGEVLTGPEISLLADVCNGTIFDPIMPQSLAMEAEDCEHTYYEQWGCKRTELLPKLEALPYHATLAVIDGIERFWRAVSTGLQVDPASILASPAGPQ